MADEVHSLIQELGRAIGIPDLALDETDTCDLLFDNSIELRLAYDAPAERLVALAAIAPVEGDKAEVIEELLAATPFSTTTAGATLSLGPNRVATLCRAWHLPDLAFPRFEEDLRALVDATETWRSHLAGGTPVTGEKHRTASASNADNQPSKDILDLLVQFGGELGVNLRPDELGVAHLAIDDVIVSLVAQADALIATAVLGQPVGPKRTELLTLMLEANYLWAGTRGDATLGYAPGSGVVTLTARWPAAGLDLPRLRTLVENFADAACAWQQAIHRTAEMEQIPASTVPPAFV